MKNIKWKLKFFLIGFYYLFKRQKYYFYYVETHKNGSRYFLATESKIAHKFLQKNQDFGSVLTCKIFNLKTIKQWIIN